MGNVMIDEDPVRWTDLKDIHEVEPLADGDYECLAEVRDVLKKHAMQGRFGVALLHKHFEMGSDEMLVEQTDVEARVLTIAPVKAAEADGAIQTLWMLGDGAPSAMFGCMQYCARDVQGNHNSFHRMT